MAMLDVKASSFSGSFIGLNKTHSIVVSKRRCLKFATTIGLPIFGVAINQSNHAIALASYKALAIKCAVDFTGTSLTRPAGYKQMDPSEKANISYWTGMTFSAIIADELLLVSRLVHASTFYRNNLVKVNIKSRSLADLVGQDSKGAWHVVEAKGRQADPSNQDRVDWKKQATTIKTIKGIYPSTRSYCFTKVEDIYSAEFVDPEDNETNYGVSIDFENSAMIGGYYGVLVDWLKDDAINFVSDDTRLIIKLAGFDPTDREYIYLGLTHKALNSLKENTLPACIGPLETADSYVGSDSISITTSPEPLRQL
jgi:hypothetical protein